MSKERLEEIKRKFLQSDDDDIAYLIQQKEEKIQLEERVKELENQLEVTGNELTLVSEENQRYKQALRKAVKIMQDYAIGDVNAEVDMMHFVEEWVEVAGDTNA